MFIIKKYLNMVMVAVVLYLLTFVSIKYHTLTMTIEKQKSKIASLESKIEKERSDRIQAVLEKNKIEDKYDLLSKSATEEIEDNLTKRLDLLHAIKNTKIFNLATPASKELNITNTNISEVKKDDVIDSIYFMYENVTGEVIK